MHAGWGLADPAEERKLPGKGSGWRRAGRTPL
ncbi:MAG: hypothetical protein JWQ89_1290, partial [Devosia sp.]|nr:hypothetical protein [Devosia sp.]